jgi:hypothetical protein
VEDLIEQGRLAGAEEAGEHGDREARVIAGRVMCSVAIH